MGWFEVRQSEPLYGSIKVPGSKNSVLALIAASCLSQEKTKLENVPDILDVHIALSILKDIGVEYKKIGSTLTIDPSSISSSDIKPAKCIEFRTAYYFIGGLLHRMKRVGVGYPGGDSIGPRPIDQHIKGLRALGSKLQFHKDYYEVEAERLKGAEIFFDVISSGATINVMLAAVLADGKTVIHNAARDPEIVDLAVFLNKMGARISGAGTHTIHVGGVKSLRGCTHRVIPDRLVAGTFMLAAAVTGGSVKVMDIIPEHMEAFLQKLGEAGTIIEKGIDDIKIIASKQVNPVLIRTGMYPALGSDYQQPFTVLLLKADGPSLVQDRIYPERFEHCKQLNKMGANISISEGVAYISIKEGLKLKGSTVTATDIRAGSSLILAGLMAEGITRVYGVEHINRGYEDIVRDLSSLGADIILADDNSLNSIKCN